MFFENLEKLRDRNKRMKLEIEIGLRYSLINWDKEDDSWVHSKAFDNYLDSWRRLRHYYLEYEEPEIGIIVIHAYERSIERIRLAIQENTSLVDDNIENLETALQSLEYEMDTIIREGSMAFNDYYHEHLNDN